MIRSFSKPRGSGCGTRSRPAELVALAGSKALSADERLGLLLILRESDRPEARAVLPGFLADPDPRIRFAAIQWVGEHRLTEFRPHCKRGWPRRPRRETCSRPRWRRSSSSTARRAVSRTKSPARTTSPPC